MKMGILRPIYETFRAQWLKFRYARVKQRLCNEYGCRKMRVGFVVYDVAKWKGQSLFDVMVASTDFNPIILILPSDTERKGTSEQQAEYISKLENYFKASGMQVKSIWDIVHNKCLMPSAIDMDLLFYQEPYVIPEELRLERASGRSLTFYYPYYVPNAFNPELGVKLSLHKTVYRYILLNDEQIRLYKPYIHLCQYAGEMVALGHPMLDAFYQRKEEKVKHNYVIYAPHFSFKGEQHAELPYYSSTFLENGRMILQYAKLHPEVNWAFKPHPRLRKELTIYGKWSEEEVNQYYAEWETIGLACYDSHYIDLFLDSRAMITDSSSFLTEYSCTCKPLIRPIPDQGKTLSPPNPALAKLYGTFYKTYDNKELKEMLDKIVLQGQDPNREERLRLVSEAKLTGTCAAQNIIDYIRDLLSNGRYTQ